MNDIRAVTFSVSRIVLACVIRQFLEDAYLIVLCVMAFPQRIKVMKVSGKLPRRPPLMRSVQNGVVDIGDYECKTWKCVPIGIPSKGREQTLCEQTLQMLRSYEYDMSMVHVFVDATHVRPDGANEYDVYFKHLQQHGFQMVNVHPGGVGLRKQYDRIFEFLKGEQEIILASDTVPRIDWRRRAHNVELEEFPKEKLLPVIRIGFDLCREYGARAWSLSSCKAGINLQAGHISLKCGLLCGNFCGVRLDVGDPIRMTISDFTTDVEFSLRTWNQDGAMVRFLGIAAHHKYRSPGGHRDGRIHDQKRHKDTCSAIRTLAKMFPQSLRFTGEAERPTKAMNYRFLQKGPKALIFKGTFSTKGRKPTNGWRAQSVRDRVRKHRSEKSKKQKNPCGDLHEE